MYNRDDDERGKKKREEERNKIGYSLFIHISFFMASFYLFGRSYIVF